MVDGVEAKRSRPRIARISLSESIARELTDDILNGVVEAGTPLREVELAQELGVSRQSLRAAMVQLASRGLLHHEMNRGFWVPDLSPDDVRDIFDNRAMIEGEAARRVAPHPERHAPILEAFRRLERLDDEVTWAEYLEVHHAFHAAIVAAAGSPRLMRQHDTLSAEGSLAMVPSRKSETYGSAKAQLPGHQALVDALQTGDGDAAAAAIRAHIQAGLDDLFPPD
jgi:DNA-binding GntR family transcriptional regulator